MFMNIPCTHSCRKLKHSQEMYCSCLRMNYVVILSKLKVTLSSPSYANETTYNSRVSTALLGCVRACGEEDTSICDCTYCEYTTNNTNCTVTETLV
jgi:hypothetical protein